MKKAKKKNLRGGSGSITRKHKESGIIGHISGPEDGLLQAHRDEDPDWSLIMMVLNARNVNSYCFCNRLPQCRDLK